jgi:hypothetical protein
MGLLKGIVLAFMMINQDVAYASPSSVYRVLAQEGRLDRWNQKPSKKLIPVLVTMEALPEGSVYGAVDA